MDTIRTDKPARNGKRNGNGNGVHVAEHVPMETLLDVLRALKRGDFTQRMPRGLGGLAGDVARELNELIDLSSRMTDELIETNNVVGRDGKLGRRAALGDAEGAWKTC